MLLFYRAENLFCGQIRHYYIISESGLHLRCPLVSFCPAATSAQRSEGTTPAVKCLPLTYLWRTCRFAMCVTGSGRLTKLQLPNSSRRSTFRNSQEFLKAGFIALPLAKELQTGSWQGEKRVFWGRVQTCARTLGGVSVRSNACMWVRDSPHFDLGRYPFLVFLIEQIQAELFYSFRFTGIICL